MLAPYEKTELRAIAEKVIVVPEDEPARLIEVVKERPDSFRIGRVLSIGLEAAKQLPELAVGDRVLYAQSVACTTAVKDRHVMHYDQVIAIVAGGSELGAAAPAAYESRTGDSYETVYPAPARTGAVGKWTGEP